MSAWAEPTHSYPKTILFILSVFKSGEVLDVQDSIFDWKEGLSGVLVLRYSKANVIKIFSTAHWVRLYSKSFTFCLQN